VEDERGREDEVVEKRRKERRRKTERRGARE
jgi:hypothetical protein